MTSTVNHNGCRDRSLVSGSVLAGILALAGCSTTYTAKVDALIGEEPAESYQSFRIVTANPEVDEDSPQYQAVSKYIKTALSGKGMYEAPEGDSADLIIEVSYGIGEPEIDWEEEVVSVGYGPMGVMTQIVPVTKYRKHLKISARDNWEDTSLENSEEVWCIIVTLSDESEDLETYLPVLVAAGQDLIGMDTQGQMEVKVKSKSDEVDFIRGGQ